MKAVLVIDMPKRCCDCPLFTWIDHDDFDDEYGHCDDRNKLKLKDGYAPIRFDEKPDWCPLIHPLKYGSNDFYIYDRKYLFENLDREIGLLKKAKRFEEFMNEKEQ